jgi:hypothetical protein
MKNLNEVKGPVGKVVSIKLRSARFCSRKVRWPLTREVFKHHCYRRGPVKLHKRLSSRLLYSYWRGNMWVPRVEGRLLDANLYQGKWARGNHNGPITVSRIQSKCCASSWRLPFSPFRKLVPFIALSHNLVDQTSLVLPNASSRSFLRMGTLNLYPNFCPFLQLMHKLPRIYPSRMLQKA